MTSENRLHKCVMVVEDNPDLQYMYKLIIERMGYTVFTANHGEDALKKLETLDEANKPCLILTDLMMPELDGYALAQQLAKHSTLAVIPVVIMSGGAEGHPARDQILKKPVSVATLMHVVELHCGQAPVIPKDGVLISAKVF